MSKRHSKIKKVEDDLKMRIDGHNVGNVTIREALSLILQNLNINIEFMSVNAIKTWINTAFSLIEECFEWGEKDAALKRKIKDSRIYINKINDHTTMLKFVNNFMLSLEGLGVLYR